MIAAALIAPVVVALASPTPQPHQTDGCGPIFTEVTRPTVATSACTLRPHHMIAENGWSNTVITGPGGGAVRSFPQMFIHFGSWDPHLEFTITPPSWNRVDAGGTITEGAADLAFGAKYELGYDANAVWGIGVQESLPTGDAPFTAGLPQYTEDVNWTIAMGQVYSVGGTVAFSTVAGADPQGREGRVGTFAPSFVFGAAVAPTSQLFAEYTPFSRAGVGLGPRILYDLGETRQLTPNTQVDAEYGFSPTVILGQREHYIGVGISFMR